MKIKWREIDIGSASCQHSLSGILYFLQIVYTRVVEISIKMTKIHFFYCDELINDLYNKSKMLKI